MALQITTNQTNSTLKSTDKGLALDTVTMVVNFIGTDNYFGGQVVLTAEDDNISFTSTVEEFQTLAIAKSKKMISESELIKVNESQDVTGL